jgi:hypothetical protein
MYLTIPSHVNISVTDSAELPIHGGFLQVTASGLQVELELEGCQCQWGQGTRTDEVTRIKILQYLVQGFKLPA